MKKIITIVGARPQFIKASAVSRALADLSGVEERIVHTGQHFDDNMSDVFFSQMSIPRPSHNLNIHGGSHGQMTGRMLEQIEVVLQTERPELVVVYGDTNSTLAGALAAAKLNIPVAHVEAGLRSGNMKMPEEINRILTDQISEILFCPTDLAVANLHAEGVVNRQTKVVNVGDVMQDASIHFAQMACAPRGMKERAPFLLATIHRAENTDDIDRLREIVAGLNSVHTSVCPVVIPLHPRTRNAIRDNGLVLEVEKIEPIGYLEMLWLLGRCCAVLTDSGGLQKEAYFFSKPCVTVRDETEWRELLQINANRLVCADRQTIETEVSAAISRKVEGGAQLYGGGRAAERIVKTLVEKLTLQ